uniref:ATP-dependent DNA helicase RecG n=1 Tax=Candidatus Kentrum sp. FW TaxID=2126338 RepID=A0A450TK34_9GAMM|nr:MAG: ATP-dependent DNA helicase RecG [Candidatus Kentron sp. FW]
MKNAGPHTQNLPDLIAQGENSAVEFKREEADAENLAREFVAFSNSQGGVLLLGVTDDGQVSGVSDPVSQEECLCNIARDSVHPPIHITPHRFEVSHKTIFRVEIPKGKGRPYQTRKSQCPIRVGSTNRVATQGESLCLFQAAGVFHYDATEAGEIGIADLNLAWLDAYFRQSPHPENPEPKSSICGS